MMKKTKLGGLRPGSGRPKGTGKYRERTLPIRVPQSLIPQVQNLLSYYLAGIYPSLPTAISEAPLTIPEISSVSPTSASSGKTFDGTLKTACNIPLYSAKVAAGFPSPADDYIEAKLDLNEHLVKHPAATFFVRVEGESMIGAGIYPDDILIVDRSLKPSNGKIVIAVLNGELTVKRLKLGQGGALSLLPENDKFPVIHVTEEMNFNLWGVVTNVIHSV